MFNAPRQSRSTQRYSTTSSSSSAPNGFQSASFTAENPLLNSVYDGLDPWSTAPSPELPASAPPPAAASGGAPSSFGALITDSTAPPFYHKAFAAVDTSLAGEISVGALSRVLLTSGISASVIDKIVSLVSSRPRVSKFEFFVALALVALAQSGKDISIEQVVSLASQNAIPVPKLDLDAITPSTSTLTAPPADRPIAPKPLRAPSNQHTFGDDPWSAAPPYPGPSGNLSISNGAPSSLSGTGMPREWWRRQDRIQVKILGPQGFILNRYMVYEISSERRPSIQRRYSEFAVLWDCLVHRYPFRLLPQLPPKRVGADETFLEQRRRGLQRFLNFVINHPVIKDDGFLSVFLTEPSLEQWRKHNTVSMDEESMSRRIDQVEEMSIPRDLEDKLGVVRNKIGPLIEHWQKICILADRIVKRREAAAVRNPHALFKRSFLSTYLTPNISPAPPLSASSASPNSSLPPSPRSLASSIPNLSASIMGSFASPAPLLGSARPDGAADGGFYTSYYDNPQADLSRLTITLNALNEVNGQCWRGDDCELCDGVRGGLEQVSSHVTKQAEELDHRARIMSTATLEALKSQRDLYIATRDLFLRHDRLSGDNVDRLKKRIEGTQSKLEGVRIAAKDGWQEEVDKLSNAVEKDQAMIATLMNRRVFIRHSMWHELRVVLHNRENALLTQAVHDFTRDESAFAELSASNWQSLAESVENMPYE